MAIIGNCLYDFQLITYHLPLTSVQDKKDASQSNINRLVGGMLTVFLMNCRCDFGMLYEVETYLSADHSLPRSVPRPSVTSTGTFVLVEELKRDWHHGQFLLEMK